MTRGYRRVQLPRVVRVNDVPPAMAQLVDVTVEYQRLAECLCLIPVPVVAVGIVVCSLLGWVDKR